MPTQQQRSDATREALLAACRRLLLKQGLEVTTLASVLAETGMSKGALYHHFASKTDLVAAIYRAESQGAIARAMRRAQSRAAGSALARLGLASAAWLFEIRDPDVAAILFRIGPAALGIEAAQRIENEHSLALFEQLLADAADAGEIGQINRPLTARLLNAVMTELALANLQRNPAPLPDVQRLISGLLKAMEDGG